VAEFLGRGEHDEGDVDVAEDGELVRLLDEPVPALGECHLPVRDVLYPLDLKLHAPHGVRSPSGEREEREREDLRIAITRRRRDETQKVRRRLCASGDFGGRREFVGRTVSAAVRQRPSRLARERRGTGLHHSAG
jgi:hypothetical protein